MSHKIKINLLFKCGGKNFKFIVYKWNYTKIYGKRKKENSDGKSDKNMKKLK